VTSPTLLTLDNLTIGYESHTVLSGLQITLASGRFIGLLGTNGSGKSTLIKTILGILPSLAGRVVFEPVNEREPVLGYVPQREALDANYLFSAYEVVLMGCYGRVKIGRFIPPEEKRWARECLEATGAEELADQQFAELSGGQKQRVLIARALATKPALLLLDEPTAGIDAAATLAIMELLRRLHAEQKLTILMVSHDLPSVRKYAQEIIWLQHGRAVHGSVGELLSREKIEELLDLQLG
jgi:ABC-type Mn2+/Zn2+ transport system ATPase subunit